MRDRPTNLHEREGDGKRNILLGWPYSQCDCDCYMLQFSNRALEVTVWDYDKVGSSEFIGEVRNMFYNSFNSSACSKFVA